MKICILHDVVQARHCIKHKIYNHAALYSTHSSVDTYLSQKHKIECNCLTKFITQEDVAMLKEEVSKKVDSILGKLDEEVSSQINAKTGFKLNYFVQLYGYLGKFHLLGYECLSIAIKKILAKTDVDEILFYNYKFNQHFKCNSDLELYLAKVFPNIKKRKINYWKFGSKNDEIFLKFLYVLNKVFTRSFVVVKRRFKEAVSVSKNLNGNKLLKTKPTLVLLEPLYDMSFLKEEIKNFNILYYPCKASYPAGFRKNKIKFDNIFYASECNDDKNKLSTLFYNDLMYDFSFNHKNYLNAISFLNDIYKDYPIGLAIWGNPPYEGIRALICDFLRSKGVKIIGSQHGAVYGDSKENWHFDSDFTRCDLFFSYGFNNDDLQRLYPEKLIKTKIIPVGKISGIKETANKRQIDILFPLTNSISIFDGGCLRTTPHELTLRQIYLLKYLESLKSKHIYVKPFVNSNYQNCSVLPVISSLKNVKLVNDLSLLEFLTKFKPKIVLLDLPSTPLYEVLGLDAEIFLLDDAGHPFESQALERLKKRVHYFTDLVEMIRNIDAFLDGKLEKKRDRDFFKYYVSQKIENKAILEFIDKESQCINA